MEAVVAAFNQEKALVGAFSVIVQLNRLIDLRHYLLHYTGPGPPAGDVPDEAEEVGGLGEDGEVEEDEALLHGGLPLHAGPLRAADHRYNK